MKGLGCGCADEGSQAGLSPILLLSPRLPFGTLNKLQC